MIFCDTAFLFGFFFKNDPHYKNAHSIANGLDWSQVYVSKSVFEEFVTLITYKVSVERAKQIGDLILNHERPFQFIRVDEGYFEDIWENFQSIGPHRFSFVDISLITLADLMDAQVLTFDTALNSAIAQL